MQRVVNVQESLERARLVSQVMSLTISGNSFFVQSAMTSDPAESQRLHAEGKARVDEASRLRDAFWSKYPKALISQTCPWMNRNG